MYKKGHTGMIKVKRATDEKPGTLEIKVRIGGHGANTGNVKDLKQLSGYHHLVLLPVVPVQSCDVVCREAHLLQARRLFPCIHCMLLCGIICITTQLSKAHSPV